jgi:capsid protein
MAAEKLSNQRARPNAGFLNRVAATVRTAFGYHVIDTSRNRRQIPSRNLKTEDKTLTKEKRERLIETARDSTRNFAITAWCVRKHLDFVTSHHFHCRDDDRGLRMDVEAYIAARMKADAFDARRRHPMDRWIRIKEARAVLDGDIFGVRLASGQMQAIEGIYCRNPRRKVNGKDPANWVNGCYLDAAGATQAYCFATKPNEDQTVDEVVNREKVVHHGYFDRFDQVRGIGLITPGLATAVDLYETLDYAVAKAKVAQLFALAIYRQGDAAPAPLTTVAAAGDNTPGTPKEQREIDFGKGPVFLDLEGGERAEFLSTQSPGIDAEFLRTLCILTLSALDLPYCWLDASDANFFGNRGALILYLQSAKQKRKAIVTIRNDWVEWQLERAFANGDLLRPSGKPSIPFVWQAEGVPFWNPAQEVTAHLSAIDGVLDTRQRIVEETLGMDWDDLLEQADYERKQLAERGLLIDKQRHPVEGSQPTDKELEGKRTRNGKAHPRFVLQP